MKKYGADGQGSVRACGVGVAEASARSAHAEALLDKTVRRAIDEDGAQALVLGSGAYAGRAAELAGRYGVQFIDGLSAAIGTVSSRIRI